MIRKRYFFDGRTANAHFPGIGRYAVNLARAMSRQLAADEELFVLRDPSQPVLFDGFENLEGRARILDLAVSPFSLAQQWAVPRLLRRYRACVYHSPYLLMPVFPGVASVVTIHDLIPLLFPAESTGKARLFFRVALALALRRASRVLVVSEATRRDLESLYGMAKGRIRVSLEGPAQGFGPATAEAIAAVRGHYGLPERYALYLGSNKPHKNLDRLVQVWQTLDPTPFPLAIAGVVIPEHPLEGLASFSASGTIRQLGRVDDEALPALYSGAEAFVFPSLYEGFGLPVLEAMACGAAVLCSHASSLPEVAGDAAVYFDPTDTDSMRSALRSTLASPELLASLRRKGLARARLFTWDVAAAQTLEVYRELCVTTGKRG